MSSPSQLVQDILASKNEAKEREISQQNLVQAILEGTFQHTALERIKEEGQNEAGMPIRWSRIWEEALFLILSLDVDLVCVSGASQLQKTALNAQAMAYLSQVAGLRTIWSFPQDKVLEKLVPTQHRPLLEHWAAKEGVTKKTRWMITTNRTYSVGLGISNFLAVSTNNPSSNAAAGAGVVSITGDVLFMEEASQSSQAELRPLIRRIDAGLFSEISTPRRMLGTPGGGAGIEAAIAQCDYEFWPHADGVCPGCGQIRSLHPFGALLKPYTIRRDDGSLETRYLTPLGLPKVWHHSDPSNPLQSAYIGCPHCGTPIDDEDRYDAHYRCVRTGITLRELLNNRSQYKKQHNGTLKVGLWVGALVRKQDGRRLAQAILSDGQSPDSISDWIEQRLGIPSSALGATITRQMMMDAIRRPYFTPQSNEANIILAGIDQGRQEWYLTVTEFMYPLDGTPQSQYYEAKRNILLSAPIPKAMCEATLKEHRVMGAFIDSKPGVETAALFSAQTGVVLAEQPPHHPNVDFRLKATSDGGEEYPCWVINHQKFARTLFTHFAMGYYSVNENYATHIGDYTLKSIFRHFCSVEWDAEKADIIRAKDKIDDLFFSAMFAEAAFQLFCISPADILISRGDWAWMKLV